MYNLGHPVDCSRFRMQRHPYICAIVYWEIFTRWSLPPRVVAHAQMLQRGFGTAIPCGHDGVADITEVFDTHPAGPEPGRSEIAKAIEEIDAVTELRRSACGPGDVFENRGLLRIVEVREHLAEPLAALDVQPAEAATHPLLHGRSLEHHEVHELGHTC